MKISELIDKLNQVKGARGDLDVVVNNDVYENEFSSSYNNASEAVQNNNVDEVRVLPSGTRVRLS